MEAIIFVSMIIISGVFISTWVKSLKQRFTYEKDITNTQFNIIFITLGLIILTGTYFILVKLASFDVVDNSFYIFYYLLMAFSAIYIHIFSIYIGLNLSIKDDILNNSNKAATITIVSTLFGLSTIFAGANIGDGPGFYTVIIASGLGLITFIILMRIFDYFTNTLEHIQSDHNVHKAIRYSVLALCLSSILAYGAHGDWTNFTYTLIEFLVAWPSLILILIAIIIENIFRKQNNAFTTFFVSLIYIGFTVYAFMYLVGMFDFVNIIIESM